ncbi:MAG TPA: hypothetical protein VHX88_09010, partial [Solirubrobacteraceae bacterium]|nr:hypothetical protein [Solirubrobacteraceae bacterium]
LRGKTTTAIIAARKPQKPKRSTHTRDARQRDLRGLRRKHQVADDRAEPRRGATAGQAPHARAKLTVTLAASHTPAVVRTVTFKQPKATGRRHRR